MENRRSVKLDVLKFLEENRSEYLSGESIATSIGVSRNAVWKAISALRGDGYDVEAVSNRGYKLSYATDKLSKQGIEKYLCEHFSKSFDEDLDDLDEEIGRIGEICDKKTQNKFSNFYNIEFFASVDSTNKILKERASSGAAEGSVVVAAAQTSGRGRLGRSFYSPEESGVYLSVLLRPKMLSAAESTRITTMAAVAVCDAIESVQSAVSDKSNAPVDFKKRAPLIKWVNDVFVDGKKVCGILTEASIGLENSALEYIVLGVGINIYSPDGGFPEGIKDIAGAVFEEKMPDAKNMIVAAFLRSFFAYYNALTMEKSENFVDKEPKRAGKKIYVESYKKRSMLPGRRIRVILSGDSDSAREATAICIDDELRLLVRYDDGSTEALSSGEISIKVY